MTVAETREAIEGGEWVSITPELRPSITKTANGTIQAFYCSRKFVYLPGDIFECTIINYADPFGKIPLVNINIKGHNEWQGDHPIAAGAYNVDYVADIVYEVTPLHQGFADAMNKFPVAALNKWELNSMQDVKGKLFPAFALTQGQLYTDYDLIYIYDGLLFNGSKHVDGRAFDTAANRPTNLQVPLVRKK